MEKTFRFTCRGHPSIKATHLTTIEISQDLDITPRGDCIIGVGAVFEPKKLQDFLNGSTDLEISLSCGPFNEVIKAQYNPSFQADREIVIRRGPFLSDRTLATGADRACIDLSRDFVEMIKNPQVAIKVDLKRI